MEISNIYNFSEITQINPTISTNIEKKIDFGTLLRNELNAVSENINKAENQLQKLALGEADNLHQVMIAMEKAKLSFELVVQIRNKSLEGIQDILKMSI